MEAAPKTLAVSGLRVSLPDGRVLIDNVDLQVYIDIVLVVEIGDVAVQRWQQSNLA
jgi:hypothetical protein